MLNLMFTGNLEGNFNKLSIFIDANDNVTTNILTTAGNDGAGAMDGMTFDTGFTPDYHIIARRGNAGGDKFDIDFADLSAGTFDFFEDIGGGVNDGFSASTGAGANTGISNIDVGFDNSNAAGIGAGDGAADQAAAAAVETGLELGISLADIGATGPVRVMLLQNGGAHDFLSNQTLGGLPAGTSNLGANPNEANFNDFAGDQFFTVAVPEPTAVSILGVVGLLGLSRRRR